MVYIVFQILNKMIQKLITIFNGALGAMTFGIYYQIQTNKTIKLHNEKLEKIVLNHVKTLKNA